MNKVEKDKQLIKQLGGITKVANRLQLSRQCVYNWTKRGIPAQVKLDHQDLFLVQNKQA